jgi:Fe-S cluster assembly protein SufD
MVGLSEKTQSARDAKAFAMRTAPMVELMQQQSGMRETIARFIEGQGDRGVAGVWLKPIRAAAFDRFNELGFPTTKDEDWKFTNFAPIAKTDFALASADGQAARVAPQQVAHALVPNLFGPLMVFINGQFSPSLSTVTRLPRGLKVLPLAQALDSERDLLRLTFDHANLDREDAFTALNTAFIEDGAFIKISANATIDQPLQILNITGISQNGAPIMTHPRNYILAEEGSQCTIVEQYVSLDESVHLTNAVTDVLVGRNANVHHYFLEQESGAAYNVSTLRIRQMRDSRFASHTVLLGGKLVRNNVHAILDGENCDCLINGLYIGSESQHMDNNMRVEHAQPRCESRQFYKGILDDKAVGVFTGRIIVHLDAQKTDAKQTNKNLLLSDDAHVDTRPQLEIYADDVKCTHGATIGQLDEQAIFYLRARGLSNDSARSLLVHAFAGESLGRMNIEPIRSYLDRILLSRLPGGELLEHML